MDPVIEALQQGGVPYVTAGGGDYFRAPEVKNIMALLEAIANPEDSQATIRCLQFPEWGMTQPGRYAAWRRISKSDTPLIHLLRDGTIPGMSDRDRAAGRRFAECLFQLHDEAMNLDVRDLFERSMIASGYAGLRSLKRDVERLQFSGNVSHFKEMLDDFCAIKRSAGLSEALEYLHLMRDSGTESMEPLSASLDGVRLSTIHGAKGLEWPHVIVAGCVDGKMPSRLVPDRLSLPEGFLDDDLTPAEGHLQEELHLFYVAGTRARDSLTYTWAKRYPSNIQEGRPERKPSPFLQAIPMEMKDVEVQPPTVVDIPRARNLPVLLPDDQLRLSFSSMDRFDKCPRRYEYANIWHLPAQSSPEARLGTLVHATLEELMKMRKQGAAIDVELANAVWLSNWESRADDLRAAKHDLRAHGGHMVKRYVESDMWKRAQPHWVEYPFAMDMGDGVVLVGKLDRVDAQVDPNTTAVTGIPTVVDYKTGTPRDEATMKTNLQLKIYAAAVADLLGVDEVRCELHWLQTGTSTSVTFGPKQLDAARATAANWCQKVKAAQISGKLPAKPSAWNCANCSYRTVCDEGRGALGNDPLRF
jgi:CRISPR/Cas system-associated exonuclease Cas4 (RecB family)